MNTCVMVSPEEVEESWNSFHCLDVNGTSASDLDLRLPGHYKAIMNSISKRAGTEGRIADALLDGTLPFSQKPDF